MRKLAIACSSISIGIVAAHYVIPLYILLPAAIILAVLAAALFLFKKRVMAAVLVFTTVGLTVYGVHYSLTVAKAEKYSTDSALLEMLVISEVNDYSTYSSVRVKILSKPYSGMTANLYDYNGLMNFEIGDTVSATCKTKAANTRYGEQVDYNIARGIYVKAYLQKESALITGRKYTPQVVGALINRYFRDTAQNLFAKPESDFITALMLGDKTGLYSDTDNYIALSRSGFMHTVAVSGMHVAFVVAVISFLLGGGIVSSALCLAIVWLFVLFTGASPSAVRAAFMQSVLISAKLFNRENDSITSLSFALACILLNNPFAVSSVSLQLSFAAVLGMCIFADKLSGIVYIPVHGKKGIKRLLTKCLNYIFGIVAASLSVMIFTVPLSIYYFGYVSLLSFVMNILCLWAVPLCFGGGYFACLTASFVPKLANGIAAAVSVLVDYILFAARTVSKIKAAVLYFELPVMQWWLVLVLVCTFIFALSKLGKWQKILLPVLIAVVALTAAKLSINNSYSSKTDSYNVIDVGQGQCIAAISGNNTVLIDCGNQDEFFSNAGDAAASFLYSRERNRIDALFLTHLHSDHSNGFEHLASLTDIGMVIIPESSVSDEYYETLLEICTAKNIRIGYISSLSEYSFGRLNITVFPSDDYDSVNERCMKLMLSDSDFDMLITGDISSTVEKAFIQSYELTGIDAIVAAHHGSRYSSSGEFLSAIGGKYAVISTGTNTYGHPTYETLERLNAYGYNIYRTDLNGTVSFYIRG